MQTIGILGGVGPEATAELFRRIIRATPARRDQDHLPVLIFNNSAIPDRTAAILGRGPSPVPELERTVRVLEAAGADFVIIPCNTAHFFLAQIRGATRVPVLDMIGETASYLAAHHPGVGRAGILATTGTLRARLYHAALRRNGIRAVAPSAVAQRDLVMPAIYGENGVKAGGHAVPRRLLRRAAVHLRERGAELLVAGCTEISVVLGRVCEGLPVVDPLTVLAETAVRRATSDCVIRLKNSPEPPAKKGELVKIDKTTD